MPDVPLLEYDPMRYVTQRGAEAISERARNGRYLVTEAGDPQLVEHDGTEHLVLDDPAGVDGLPEMVHGSALLAPAPAGLTRVRITTVATRATDAGRTAVVLERDGKYLLTQPQDWFQPVWVHDEDVVVHEERVPE